MTDFRTPLAASTRELPEEEAKREERHQLLATLLGAFVDGELPAETSSQIDAHLLGCPRCRREVTLQRTLRLRLEQEPLAAAPASLRGRIASAIAAAPAPQWEVVAEAAAVPAEAPAQRGRGLLQRIGVARVVVASVIALALTAVGVRWLSQRGAPSATIVPAPAVPLFSAVLADYHRVTAGELPGRARDLATVREAVPFPVQALDAPSLRLLAAWTTSLNGEPAAVLAYRFKDQVILQYLVSDLQLYRAAEARTAFASGSALGAQDGRQTLLSWPESASGSVIVGEVPLAQLKALRGAVAPR